MSKRVKRCIRPITIVIIALVSFIVPVRIASPFSLTAELISIALVIVASAVAGVAAAVVTERWKGEA